mmetsp:Transcript_5970/g.6185  ORF Transcript_5970/g.6185 Transcript_5970/m.6185 type:complete len:84 (+) Transcript_5970:593-844(+)
MLLEEVAMVVVATVVVAMVVDMVAEEMVEEVMAVAGVLVGTVMVVVKAITMPFFQDLDIISKVKEEIIKQIQSSTATGEHNNN